MDSELLRPVARVECGQGGLEPLVTRGVHPLATRCDIVGPILHRQIGLNDFAVLKLVTFHTKCTVKNSNRYGKIWQQI